MSRPLRVCLPGVVYHVVARGNNRQPVLGTVADKTLLLNVLERVVERHGWLCHAYCVMDNHYHLLLETPAADLPRGMRQLNGLFARRYNVLHGTCGHVFQARYRAILVEKESHLLVVSRYVVLNPVRAQACSEVADWSWGSYRATAGLVEPPSFLTTDWILGHFGETRRVAQLRYRRFVADGLTDSGAEAVRGERIGSDAFLSDSFGYDPPLAEIPRRQLRPLPISLREIFGSMDPRPVETAYRQHGYTLREIADHLGCHYSTVSRRLAREESEGRQILQCKT